MPIETLPWSESLPAPREIEELMESCIQEYQHGCSSARLAMTVAEHLETLLNHPDFNEEILYWRQCQYYRLAKQWRWIASNVKDFDSDKASFNLSVRVRTRHG